MDIEFDPVKNEKNINKHGISLADAGLFDYATAKIAIDSRKDYGEVRCVSTGYIYERLHILCFVETQNGVRAISLRKANLRERKDYEKKTRIH